jgi:hypothetical protein
LTEIRFIAAAGGLGSGVDKASLFKALGVYTPHFIACDAGSTDAGPFALGRGTAAHTYESVKHDLGLMIEAGQQARIPVIVGSAGTAGADIQVDWVLGIIKEIAREQNLALKIAVIYSQQDKTYLKEMLKQDRIRPLDPAPHFDETTIERASRIVGMMGVEPLQAALAKGPDVVLAGRCSDSALYAALPIMHGIPEGLAWHAGKILECGTLACEIMGKGTMVARLTEDEAIITPVGKDLRCTPQSVAAHSFYENGDPYLHKECSGTIDLTNSVYEAYDATSVRVTGSAFIRAEEPTIKLEGAELVGYQTIMVGGVRDPFILKQFDSWLAKVKHHTLTLAARLLGDQMTSDEYSLKFHVYGRNGVMGDLEPTLSEGKMPMEVGIVVEGTAPTQELATKLVVLSRQPLLHTPVPEWSGAITGFACLHNPAHIERGAVYRFNVNHVVLPYKVEEMFRHEWVETAPGVEQPASLPGLVQV